MIRSSSIRVCAGLLLAVCAAAPAVAQIGAGGLTGSIVDQAGAAVPGAAVTVTSAGTAATRTVVTSSDGVYTVPGLLPGLYSVHAEIAGFRPLTQEHE